MVVVLSPVAEALAPRIPSVVGGRGPVPAGGIGTSYVKSADRGAVVKQHVQLGLRRHAPVSVAVRRLDGEVELFEFAFTLFASRLQLLNDLVHGRHVVPSGLLKF